MTRRSAALIVAAGLPGAFAGAPAIAANRPAKPLPDSLMEPVMRAVHAIHRLDYAEAESTCQQLMHDFPDHPVGYVYLLRVYWSEQLSDARLISAERVVSMDLFAEKPRFQPPISNQKLERLRNAANVAVTRAADGIRLHPDDPSARFLLGTAYEFKAAFEFTAAHSLADASASSNRAYKILHELSQQYDMPDAEVAAGAYSIIADSLDWFPKLAGWILFGTRGNLTEGRLALERAAYHGSIGAPDAKLLLSVLYTRQGNFDKAIALLRELETAYPENYLLPMEVASVQLVANQADRAIETYLRILERGFRVPDRSVILTRIGVASRIAALGRRPSEGDLSESSGWLQMAVDQPRDQSDSRAVSMVELGKTLDLLGDRTSAIKQYQTALQLPDSLSLHEEAERLLRRPYTREEARRDRTLGGIVGLTK